MKVELALNADDPGRGAGRVQPAADPPRPGRLHRPQAAAATTACSTTSARAPSGSEPPAASARPCRRASCEPPVGGLEVPLDLVEVGGHVLPRRAPGSPSARPVTRSTSSPRLVDSDDSWAVSSSIGVSLPWRVGANRFRALPEAHLSSPGAAATRPPGCRATTCVVACPRPAGPGRAAHRRGAGPPRRRAGAGRRRPARADRALRRRSRSTSSGCPTREVKAALDAIPADLRAALEVALANITAYHQAAAPRRRRAPQRRHHRPRAAAARRPGRLLRAVEPRAAGVDRAHDRGRRPRSPACPRSCSSPRRSADGTVAPGILAAAALAGRRRGVPGRRPRGDRRARLRHRVDPPRRRDRRARAAPASPRPSGRWPRRGSSACRPRSPGRPRSWSSPTPPTPAAFAAIDVVLQAEHGPDGLAWLVTWDEAVADAVAAAVAEIVPLLAAPGAPRGHARRGRLRRCVCDGARAGHGRRQRDRARAPRAARRRPRRAPARSCATPARCSAGRARRRRSATTWPAPTTCCPRSARPASPARSASTTSSSTSTSCRSTRDGAGRGRPPRRGAGHLRGPRRPRRVGAHPPEAQPVIAPRDDLALMAGYHSPQVDGGRPAQHQRGARAAAAGLRRRARRASWPRVDWHRYPDRVVHRAARGHRRAPRRRPGDGVRGQRLQRGAADAVPRLRRPGPLGRGVRADVRAAQPHRPHHRAPAWPSASAPTTSPSTSTRCAACSAEAAPADHVPVLAQQPHRHGRGRGDGPRGARPRARPARRRRGLRPVRAVVGARAGRRRRAARRHPHLLEDVVDGRRPPRLPRRAVARSWPSSTRWCCRTTSTR